MNNDKQNITTVNNSGTIGAAAIGDGATAVNAGGNVDMKNAAYDAQCIALEKTIRLSESEQELMNILEKAKSSLNVDPKESRKWWEMLIAHGGAIGSIASAILAGLSM